MNTLNTFLRSLCLTIFLMLTWTQAVAAAECSVLAVMGFQENFFRSEEIREGIEERLQGECDMHYAYLNALSDPDNIGVRAREAYALFQELQPDGVIATNDEAQAFFVVPYLKGKVDTPVVFCDINESPDTFGYPTEQITGILRRPPIGDTIVFAQQIVPEIATVGFLFAEEPTSEALAKQIQAEGGTYAATILDPAYVTTFDGAIAAAGALKDDCDALFIGPIGTLLADADGNPIPMPALVTGIAQEFGKPTITIWDIVVRSGALCAVSDFGQEQGQVAADMLLQAMQGTPMADIPITQNQFGQRFLNKDTLKALGITPSRRVLVGAEIVETMQ